MAWNGPQPAPRALFALIHVNFPVTRNLGIYNPRRIAGTNRPSLHSEGRALDIGLLVSRPNEKTIADGLFQIFVEVADDMELQEIIWNHKIWSSARPFIHNHTGQNPHTDHVHVGFTRDGSQATTLPVLFHMKLATLRTGLEDLNRALETTA